MRNPQASVTRLLGCCSEIELCADMQTKKRGFCLVSIQRIERTGIIPSRFARTWSLDISIPIVLPIPISAGGSAPISISQFTDSKLLREGDLNTSYASR